MSVGPAQRTGETLVRRLLAAVEPDGHWEGRLSTSALSTATAVVALAEVDALAHGQQIEAGLDWLATHANADGGYGDTVRSHANIATTALVWAALSLARTPTQQAAAARAEAWLAAKAGEMTPARLAKAIMRSYGKDHTFSVPILTMLAIRGRLGAEGFGLVAPLPFELAAAPQRLYQWLRMPVVSYALPALIAIGQVIHHRRPTRNPLTGSLRRWTAAPTLRLLTRIQPQNGGFLEAIPLTAFVAMSLAHMGRADHPVAQRGVGFLLERQRADGSWPIDTHLATWVTTLAVNALGPRLPAELATKSRSWLLAQQVRQVHPYTGAAPGGWSWTPLPGGVPDADDTAGAILALTRLGEDPALAEAARAGLDWLAGLQNGDGGMPTFCRGWGTLPFDMSCADISAHALAAFGAWRARGLDNGRYRRTSAGLVRYLLRTQDREGYWLPLWFGNQDHPQRANPVYGTARVLMALQREDQPPEPKLVGAVARARAWLCAQAGPDGGFGATTGTPTSIEETALALAALRLGQLNEAEQSVAAQAQAWLVEHTAEGQHTPSAPIGFYFANLWYDEELYPLIFATAALI